MQFREVCTAKTNFAEADFWIVASGNDMGTPIKVFAPQHIGIKVVRTDVLVPKFLYFLMEYQQTRGIYAGQQRLRPAFFDRISFV